MKLYISILFLLLLNAGELKAQGCSDAGVCSVGGATQYPNDSTTTNQDEPALFVFRATTSFSSGEQGVLSFQEIPEVEFYLSKRTQLLTRIPFSINAGNLGTTSGIGDPYIGFSTTVFALKTGKISFSGGVKIPAGKTDINAERKPLPMPYQTGLGTTDGLFSVSWLHERLHVAAVYQHIFKQGNTNGFLRSRWEGIKNAQEYFESNRLKRGNDFSLRADYAFNWKKGKIYTGILSIYRLSEDKITELSGEENQVKGSDGLTLNITASAYYQFTPQQRLTAQIGFPIVVREVRSDGLTRSAVINLIYAIRINKKQNDTTGR